MRCDACCHFTPTAHGSRSRQLLPDALSSLSRGVSSTHLDLPSDYFNDSSFSAPRELRCWYLRAPSQRTHQWVAVRCVRGWSAGQSGRPSVHCTQTSRRAYEQQTRAVLPSFSMTLRHLPHASLVFWPDQGFAFLHSPCRLPDTGPSRDKRGCVWRRWPRGIDYLPGLPTQPCPRCISCRVHGQ